MLNPLESSSFHLNLSYVDVFKGSAGENLGTRKVRSDIEVEWLWLFYTF